MNYKNGQFSVYGNTISKAQSKQVIRWQDFFVKKFNFDPGEEYKLSLVDNDYLGSIFGLKEIVRYDQGEPISIPVNPSRFVEYKGF